MSQDIIPIIMTFATLYASCGLAFFFSNRSVSPVLSRILKYSAIFWAFWLTLCSGALIAISVLCRGNWLYGYTQCTGLSEDMAEFIVATAILSWLGGIGWGGVALIGGVIWEYVARSRSTV